MNGKQKRDQLLKEVIKPLLKEAGFLFKFGCFVAEKEQCFLVIRIQNSQFNSEYTGYSFWFNVGILEKREELILEKEIKQLRDGIFAIRESCLLPDGGFLHPYRTPIGYCIDFYKDGNPQDISYEEIEMAIRQDLLEHIFPKLLPIERIEDWKIQKQKWEAELNTKRMRLIRYYSSERGLGQIESNRPMLEQLRKDYGLTNKELKENIEILKQLRDLYGIT